MQYLPNIICWEIWKKRCAFRYEEQKTSSYRLINLIKDSMLLLVTVHFNLPHIFDWNPLMEKLTRIKPILKIIPIKWAKPPDYKLNTDGCSKGNPGASGGGGCLRDHNGNLVMAFRSFLGNCTNNFAEASAILIDMNWCINNGILNVIIESDSMIVINSINKKMTSHWQIRSIIEKIEDLKEKGQFYFAHCYREANTVADTAQKVNSR